MDPNAHRFRPHEETTISTLRLNIEHLVILGLLCASVHWLIARSLIFEWLWSRVTGWGQRLLSCPACCGFWIALALGVAGVRPVTGLRWWVEVTAAGLLGVYLTPVVEGTLLWGLARSSMVMTTDDTTPVVTYGNDDT